MSQETTIEKLEIERIFLGFTLQAQKKLVDDFKKQAKRVIVISGPTACGKTAFAIQLAKEINGEVISADSMQIYRGMDIGTAKATKEQTQEIEHHLIDIRNINDPFNVVDFYYEARQCCQQIINKGKVPIVVGGSGFYIHSFLYGPPDGPPSIQELRKSIESELETCGVEAMYQKLCSLDPQYASTITKNDKQKIVRALEIINLTGKKVSNLSWKTRKHPQHYDFHCWFFYRPREHLYQLIDKRCDEMLANGFIEEVKKLMALGIEENSSASQAIGYRQAITFLRSAQTQEEFTTLVSSFKTASKKYAKRQLTWFKREKIFDKWIDMDAYDTCEVLDLVKKDYEGWKIQDLPPPR